MEPLDGSLKDKMILLCPPYPVSTPGAYRALDERFGNFEDPNRFKPCKATGLLAVLQNGDAEQHQEAFFNRFEAVTENLGDTNAVLKLLKKNGSFKVLLSGSGPSRFALFSSDMPDSLLCSICESVQKNGWFCKQVRMQGPVSDFLI